MIRPPMWQNGASKIHSNFKQQYISQERSMPNLQKLKYCHINLALFAFAASMMIIAFFFFQKYLGLLPCPLCVTQRIFAIGFGVIALIAALHNPAPHKQRIYSTFIALTAAAGAGV